MDITGNQLQFCSHMLTSVLAWIQTQNKQVHVHDTQIRTRASAWYQVLKHLQHVVVCSCFLDVSLHLIGNAA